MNVLLEYNYVYHKLNKQIEYIFSLNKRKDFPHLRIPVITLINPLCFLSINLFRYKPILIIIKTLHFKNLSQSYSFQKCITRKNTKSK